MTDSATQVDLELTPIQKNMLSALSTLDDHFFHDRLSMLIAPALNTIANGILVSTQCPYGDSGHNTYVDHDRQGNRYITCTHEPRHCWDYASGKYMGCP